MRKVLRKISPPNAAPETSADPAEPEVSPVDWDGIVPDPPARKKLVSLRLDADVIAFFQSDGKGYQTRMNAVLRSYMNARKDTP